MDIEKKTNIVKRAEAKFNLFNDIYGKPFGFMYNDQVFTNLDLFFLKQDDSKYYFSTPSRKAVNDYYSGSKLVSSSIIAYYHSDVDDIEFVSYRIEFASRYNTLLDELSVKFGFKHYLDSINEFEELVIKSCPSFAGFKVELSFNFDKTLNEVSIILQYDRSKHNFYTDKINIFSIPFKNILSLNTETDMLAFARLQTLGILYDDLLEFFGFDDWKIFFNSYKENIKGFEEIIYMREV